MKITLTNVRLSFPALFKGRAFEEGDDPKYEATALMGKESNQTKKLGKIIKDMIEGSFDAKDRKKVQSCFKDGSVKEDTDGYSDEIMFIKASSKKRPTVVDRDLAPVTEEDGVIFGGCYVNMAIRLWVQDNKWGKRINAELLGMQFVKEGESFGESPFKAEEAFSAMDDSEEEDYSDI